MDWVARHPLLEKRNIENAKKIVDIMAEIMANSLDRYLIAISNLICGIVSISSDAVFNY